MNKEESLALFAKGKDAWNEWAARMLEERKALETAGTWTLSQDESVWNDATRAWRAAAKADFSGHQFKGSVNFSSFVFPDDARFDEVIFSGEACFEEVTFSGDAWFERAAFPDRTSFGKANFSGHASYRKVIFAGGLNFNGATVAGDAVFGGVRFSGGGDFREVVFSGNAAFAEVAFLSGVSFNGARFSSDAWFMRARFSDKASFGKATFSGRASFDKATFAAEAWFMRAIFSGGSSFDKATFAGVAWFGKATFSDGAWFSGTTFLDKAQFRQSAFSDSALFRGATFAGEARFLQCVFNGFTSFNGARFETAADFRAIEGKSAFSLADVTFTAVPDFIQAHFVEAPRLDNMRIQPRQLRRPILAGVKAYFKGDRELSGRWRTLKRLAVQDHDHTHELEFFKSELKSRRWSVDSPWSGVYVFGFFYQWLSDFGRSLWRPLIWWMINVGLFAYLYLMEHLARAPYPRSCVVGPGEPWLAALILSLRQGLLVTGLDATDKLNQLYGCLYGIFSDQSVRLGKFPEAFSPVVPDVVAILGFLHLLISAVLIFLFGLALRNNFRIK